MPQLPNILGDLFRLVITEGGLSIALIKELERPKQSAAFGQLLAHLVGSLVGPTVRLECVPARVTG